MYAQLPDVCCADPYLQEQQRIVWNERPSWAPSFIRPLYVLGVATICNSACAPKPLHIILNCVRHDTKGGPFRFATPPEKTVELFYALGAGTKSFSYWWYTPYGEFHGCGAADKEAVALWRQIGLLGAQVRTAGPVLTRSCPAVVPLKAPAKLWTRTLLAGTDTLVLLAVNENIANDRLGSVVVPLPKTHGHHHSALVAEGGGWVRDHAGGRARRELEERCRPTRPRPGQDRSRPNGSAYGGQSPPRPTGRAIPQPLRRERRPTDRPRREVSTPPAAGSV